MNLSSRIVLFSLLLASITPQRAFANTDKERDAFYQVNWRLWVFQKTHSNFVPSQEPVLNGMIRMLTNSRISLKDLHQEHSDKMAEFEACQSEEWQQWRQWYTPYDARVRIRWKKKQSKLNTRIPVMDEKGNVKVGDMATKRKFYIHPSNLRRTRGGACGIMGTPKLARELIGVFPKWGQEQYAVGSPVESGLSNPDPTAYVLLKLVSKPRADGCIVQVYEDAGTFK